ncbi:MAG: phosphatase PAP2 family protein, partial [Bdellovibrionales bacterium]|nr:phosphatase PAP2 family protein [Bdellovibrionales bacterium]
SFGPRSCKSKYSGRKSGEIYLKYLVIVLMCLRCVDIGWANERRVGKIPYSFQLKELPRHLGRGVKESFWGIQGLAFLGAAGTTFAFRPVDDSIANYFKHEPALGRRFNDIFDHVSSPITVGGGLFLVWAGSYWTQNDQLALSMESALEAWILVVPLVVGTKYVANRDRPDGSSFSFPSAHTAAAFSTATVLAHSYGYAVGVPAFLTSAFIGFMRIDSSKHYLTDVLFGAVLGTSIGLGVSRFHQPLGPNVSVTPYVTSRGSGLVYRQVF